MPDNSLLAYVKGRTRDFLRKNEVLGPIVAQLQDVVEDIRNGTGLSAGVVTGAKASATLRAKHSNGNLPTVPTAAGTTEINVIAAAAGTVSAVRITFKDALAANDTNWVQFNIKNRGQNGAGTTDVLDTGAVNSSKVTGGSAVVAYGSRTLTLNATPSNLTVAAGDVLSVQVVGTGTLANTLTEGSVKIVFDQLA
jgi:hypothetical protein